MKQPPRDPKEPIITRRHWLAIGGYGIVITASVLGSLALALLVLELPRQAAVTVSFLTLAFAQLWHVFDMRSADSRMLRNDVTRNPFVWGALALCALLLVGATYVPGVATVLKMTDPGPAGWLLVLGMSLIPLGVGQAFLSVPYHIVGGSLRLLLAQNLARRVCTECSDARPLTDDERALFEDMGLDVPDTVPEAKGCEACSSYGYSGRIGVFETVQVDRDLTRFITNRPKLEDLRQHLRERGVTSMLADGLRKVADGLTTMEEIFQFHWPIQTAPH